MNVHIESADMKKNEENHFIGHTLFSIEGYKDLYELTFFSKRGKEWDYSINFAKESGKEEDLLTIDKFIEEDDELFDQLLDAALDAMEPTASE